MFLQAFNENHVVYIPVVKIAPQLLIVHEALEFFVLHPLVDGQGCLVEPTQNGILDRQKSTSTDLLCVSPHGKQISDGFSVIPFGSSHNGSLPILSHRVDISLVFFNQQDTDLSAAVDSRSMKGSSFVIDGERLVDDGWFVIEDPFNILSILAFDVPEEIFIPRVAMGDTFHGSCHSHVIID